MFKFVEHTDNTEKQLDQKSKIKFKIMSLKVKGPMEYVPELVSYMPSGFNNASLCMLFFGLDTRLLLIDDKKANYVYLGRLKIQSPKFLVSGALYIISLFRFSVSR